MLLQHFASNKNSVNQTKQAHFKCLLEKLPRRTRRRSQIVPNTRDRPAIDGVPAVVALGPRQLALERGDQVVERPADDRVVVHAHVDVDQADRVSNPCGQSSISAFLEYKSVNSEQRKRDA